MKTKEGKSAILEAIEALKVQPRLDPFDMNDELIRAAKNHAKDIGPRGISSHTGSSGSSPFDRIAKHGTAIGC